MARDSCYNDVRSIYDATIYVYVYVNEYANLLNLSSLGNVRKATFAFYVYVYVATAKGLYYYCCIHV